MKTKLRVAIIVVTLSVITTMCVLITGGKKPNDVSLIFQRYSDLDPYAFGDVAFLCLTNASNKSFLLTMTGNSNTHVWYSQFGRTKESWMVNCEFSDHTQHGWTNWIQLPSPARGSNSYVRLGPRSGIIVRVPLLANGQHRKAAVLYEVPVTASSFWLSPAGFRILRMLPQSLRIRMLKPQLLKVWCDRELSFPSEDTSKR